MKTVRFEVDEVFDISSRGGLVVVGTLTHGEVGPGAMLYDAATGAPVRVLAVDFLTPGAVRTGRVSIVIERADAGSLGRDAVLVRD